MTRDERYMQRCLELAAKGAGNVSPNPMVGCVVVNGDRIIGEGWHQEFGGPHAEVHAINSVKDHSLLKTATAYVNLEPCSHYGKTPPCADLLIERGIPKVVIAATDDNPEVSGRGIAKMRRAGIEIVTGILQAEARTLNRPFYSYHNLQRPFILLKWAQTENGVFAPENGQLWLSSDASKRLTHRFRHGMDAILVGRKTAATDDPQLTDRYWGGRHPVRIVIDPRNTLPDDLRMFNVDGPVVIFNLVRDGHSGNREFIRLSGPDFDPAEIIRALYLRNITSLLVEGGAYTLNRFIESGLWDEAVVYHTDTRIEDGIPAPVLDRPPSGRHDLDGDHIAVYQP